MGVRVKPLVWEPRYNKEGETARTILGHYTLREVGVRIMLYFSGMADPRCDGFVTIDAAKAAAQADYEARILSAIEEDG